jgi:two-component system chemotaxis response regulator CheB
MSSQNPRNTQAGNCVVAIGASAGGVEALQLLFRALPANLPASFLVVLHIPPHTPSQLDKVLQDCTAMPVQPAQDDEALVPGTVYVGRNDLHLMVDESGRNIRLTRGPKECRTRPAIDVLFRSVATASGPRAIGISLSGMLDEMPSNSE